MPDTKTIIAGLLVVTGVGVITVGEHRREEQAEADRNSSVGQVSSVSFPDRDLQQESLTDDISSIDAIGFVEKGKSPLHHNDDDHNNDDYDEEDNNSYMVNDRNTRQQKRTNGNEKVDNSNDSNENSFPISRWPNMFKNSNNKYATLRNQEDDATAV